MTTVLPPQRTAGPGRPGAPPARAWSSTSRSYAAFARRNRWLLVVGVLVGALCGGAVFLQQPVVSTAVTRIALTPQESSPGADLGRPRLISLDSDAQVLTSVQVLSVAAAAAGYPGGFEALEEATSVSAIADTRILVLRVTDVSVERATAAADAIAAEFLRVRGESGTLRADGARARLQEQVASVSDRLVVLRASAAGGVLLAGDELEEGELIASLGALQAELARNVTTAADPGRVVLPATVLRPGGRPMGLATLASGALLGGVGGLAVAAARDQARGLRRPLRRPH